MKELKYKYGFAGFEPYSQPVLEDDEGNIYSRTVAGLGWPSEKPGALVVVAEELTQSVFGKASLHVMSIEESWDIDELLVKSQEAKSVFKFEQLFANRHKRDQIRYLTDFNHRQARMRNREVYARLPVFWSSSGSIATHLQMAKLALSPESKFLYLGEHQRIASVLSEVLADKIHSLTDSDEPLLAAFAFAVAFLMAHPFRMDSVQPPKKQWDMWELLRD